ncbi:MAG: YkgJ family cysteine cluster protein [Myxococcota bacterium]
MSSALESLCQACGLCCDGSLFTRVPLGVDEQVPEGELGVVTNEKGARHVPQRCAALGGTVCGVYAQRPRACRRYECLLFAALREGEVALAEAIDVVRRAQALVAAARVEPGRRAVRDEFLSFHFGRR